MHALTILMIIFALITDLNDGDLEEINFISPSAINLSISDAAKGISLGKIDKTQFLICNASQLIYFQIEDLPIRGHIAPLLKIMSSCHAGSAGGIPLKRDVPRQGVFCQP